MSKAYGVTGVLWVAQTILVVVLAILAIVFIAPVEHVCMRTIGDQEEEKDE